VFSGGGELAEPPNEILDCDLLHRGCWPSRKRFVVTIIIWVPGLDIFADASKYKFGRTLFNFQQQLVQILAVSVQSLFVMI